MTPLLIALALLTGQQQTAPGDDEEEAQTPRLQLSQPAAPPVGQTKAQTAGSPAATNPSSNPSPGYAVAPGASAPMETLAPAPTVRPFEMPAYTPAAPGPYAAAVPAPGAQAPAQTPAQSPAKAVSVEQYRGSYEAPRDAQDQYYDQGVRSHFQAEQAMMGSLDGQWTVASEAGAPLLSVILNDQGTGAQLEGAWRDLAAAAKGPGTSVGVIESVQREQAGLTLLIRRDGQAAPTILRLHPTPDGRWKGEMQAPAARQPVVMARAPAASAPQ